MILTSSQQLPKNGEDWGKLIVIKGFKKLPNLVTLAVQYLNLNENGQYPVSLFVFRPLQTTIQFNNK